MSSRPIAGEAGSSIASSHRGERPAFRTEIAMSEAKTAEAPPPGDVLERGLLIGGKSVPASSGKLADDVCPWDGELYARVAAGTPADITRAADAAQAAFPGWSQLGAFERRERS